MKAVFLDRNTFSPNIDLPMPEGITKWIVFDKTNDSEKLERLKDAQIVVTNKVIIDEALLAALPKLKLVQITATGTNNVDQEAAKKYGVVVKNVAGYSSDSVAEHTFMMMLSAMRGLLQYHTASINGEWQKDGRFCLVDLPIIDLKDKVLVIVGGGNIGKRVRQIAEVFGMKVFFAERQGQPTRNSEYLNFEEAFTIADVISVHCPLTPETANIISANTLKYCQKQPLIINMARGGVANSADVLSALNERKILGYATDVFINEPPKDDEVLLTLKNHPRVLFTPHNAWASENAQRKLWAILSRQVSEFIKESLS